MASTFKNLSPNDKVSTKTLLHEAIPLTGTILSGTYGTNNIKNYSHGMFQSVYDYPYLSSSANHIFDITTAFANDSALSASTTAAVAQRSKKINIYNQMAQVLVGYDKTGSIQQFDEDGDLSQGTKLKECVFLNFSRLLVKDEIKKGSFEMTLGVGQAYASPFAKTIKIADTDAATSYKINSPVGEYGILFADSVTGTNLTTDNGTQKCGLIYYQAGVIALSSSVFDTSAASAASATITFTGDPTINQTIIIVSTDGTSRTYSAKSSANASALTFDCNNGVATSATTLAAAKNHSNGHSGKITATNPSTGVVALAQDANGVGGNTVITSTLSNTTVVSFAGGGDGNGILVTSLGAPDMISGTGFGSFKSLLTGSSISGSADALRHRIQNIQFNNTVELNSTIYFCRVNHNEYNYSANPTYLSSSQIRVKSESTDSPVSYITTVGLYSTDNQLLAVGKLSEPLKKDPTVEYTLRARLDY